MKFTAQFALGWCPAPQRVPQPNRRAEAFARMLAETKIGWPLEWRAWSPRFADGALLSSYDNVPNVELDGIAPSELLTGQIRIAIADIRDGQLVRLSTAPSHAVPEATLLLCEYAPGWAWTPENTPCVWQFRSSLYHGLVYHIGGGPLMASRHREQNIISPHPLWPRAHRGLLVGQCI